MEGLTNRYARLAERAAKNAQNQRAQKGQRRKRGGGKYDDEKMVLPVIENHRERRPAPRDHRANSAANPRTSSASWSTPVPGTSLSMRVVRCTAACIR